MNLAELINSAQQLDSIKTPTSKPELEIIIQPPNGRKMGINANEFIKVYTAISSDAKKHPVELMVDKIHSNIKDSSVVRFNNTRTTNIYIPKENEPGYKRVKMIRIIKKRYAPYEGEGFKVVLSTEEVFENEGQPGESAGQNDYARIKVRTAFTDWPKAPGWKIDITAVWGMPWPTQIKHLQTIIKNCFDSWKDVSAKDIGHAKLNKFNSFEIEAEYVGDYSKLDDKLILDVVTSINNIIQNKQVNENDDILYAEVANVAKLINHTHIQPNMTVKKVSAAPIELNMNTWKQIYPPYGWYVTDKADGKRTIIHLFGNKLIILSDSAKIITLTGSNQARTIVDSEEVDGKYYVFDVLFLKDSNISKFAFQRRYEEIEPAVKHIADVCKDINIQIFAKPFNRLPIVVPETSRLDDEFRPPIEKMWLRDRPYEIDGLIFNSPDAAYTNTKMYKWKPKNSIDFLAIRCPASLLGPAPFLVKPGQTLFLLFVTISYDHYRNFGVSLMEGYNKVFPQYSIVHSNKVQPLPSGGAQSKFPIQFSPLFYPKAFLYYVKNAPAEETKVEETKAEESKNQETKAELPIEGTKETTSAAENQQKLEAKLLSADKSIIVELYVDITTKEAQAELSKIIQSGKPLPWKILNIREDRQTDVAAGGYFGNYISIAESISQNIINPFPLENLWSTKAIYFEESRKDPIYDAGTHFNSFVKSKLFKELKPEIIHREYNSKAGNILLDVAAGRGADLGRYTLGEFTHVVCVDKDATALSELSSRKYSKYYKSLPQINTAQFDINESPEIQEYFQNVGMPVHYDAISCNFAIHYFTKLTQFIGIIDKLLKPGGKFGFTCFDGSRVNKLLSGKQMGESWVAIEEDFVKYQIQKMYSGDNLTTRDQIIKVKLPFSEELYAENLVNIENIIDQFQKKHYKVVMRRPFSDFINDFAEENPSEQKKMTENDIFYTGLYELVIIVKNHQ